MTLSFAISEQKKILNLFMNQRSHKTTGINTTYKICPASESVKTFLHEKNNNDFGQISHYQILLPEQLLEEFVQALHGHNANHPGITKVIQEARQKYY